MRTISLSVSEVDYESFREASARTGRPIAELIREAMAVYRAERLDARPRLRELPLLVGVRAIAPLPERWEVYDEMYAPKAPDPITPQRRRAKSKRR